MPPDPPSACAGALARRPVLVERRRLGAARVSHTNSVAGWAGGAYSVGMASVRAGRHGVAFVGGRASDTINSRAPQCWGGPAATFGCTQPARHTPTHTAEDMGRATAPHGAPTPCVRPGQCGGHLGWCASAPGAAGVGARRQCAAAGCSERQHMAAAGAGDRGALGPPQVSAGGTWAAICGRRHSWCHPAPARGSEGGS